MLLSEHEGKKHLLRLDDFFFYRIFYQRKKVILCNEAFGSYNILFCMYHYGVHSQQ